MVVGGIDSGGARLHGDAILFASPRFVNRAEGCSSAASGGRARIPSATPIQSSTCNPACNRSNQLACPPASIPTRTFGGSAQEHRTHHFTFFNRKLSHG